MITTERLILRRARMEDLDDLHAVFSHPEAMRYWDSLPFENIEQTRRFLTGMIEASPQDSDDFVIEWSDSSRVIGKAGCWAHGEIGVILHPDYWRKGIAFEALSAAIPHVFENLAIDKLVADVDPRNVASLALLASLGFIETGRAKQTIKVGDEWCDSVYLELLRPRTG